MVISTKNMHPNECGGMDWPHTIQTDFGAQLGHAEELQSDTTGDGGMIGRVIVYGIIAVVAIGSAAAVLL